MEKAGSEKHLTETLRLSQAPNPSGPPQPSLFGTPAKPQPQTPLLATCKMPQESVGGNKRIGKPPLSPPTPDHFNFRTCYATSKSADPPQNQRTICPGPTTRSSQHLFSSAQAPPFPNPPPHSASLQTRKCVGHCVCVCLSVCARLSLI